MNAPFVFTQDTLASQTPCGACGTPVSGLDLNYTEINVPPGGYHALGGHPLQDISAARRQTLCRSCWSKVHYAAYNTLLKIKGGSK